MKTSKIFKGWVQEYSLHSRLDESLLKTEDDYAPDVIFKNKELSRVIHELLRGLSPYEELVLEYLMEGFSVTQISRKLGLSVKRVSAVKIRAIRKMRRPERIRKIKNYLY